MSHLRQKFVILNSIWNAKVVITWGISAWAGNSAQMAGAKINCNYMENFTPGWKSRGEWMEIIVLTRAEHDYMRNFQPD